jgi:hypothetical protein
MRADMRNIAYPCLVALIASTSCSGMERRIDHDAAVEEDVGLEVDAEPPPPEPECEPEEEVCDGADNDCDGEADEDIPPEPCDGGGSSRCVMGEWSECPPVCQGCVPGSTRHCFDAYCTGWGVQTCNSSGTAWDYCQEMDVPGACDDGTGWAPTEPATGECCVAEGYCCQDYWDLDGDGQTDDSIGTCYGIDCRP